MDGKCISLLVPIISFAGEIIYRNDYFVDGSKKSYRCKTIKIFIPYNKNNKHRYSDNFIKIDDYFDEEKIYDSNRLKKDKTLIKSERADYVQ